MPAQATVTANRAQRTGSKRRLRFLMIFVLCFLCWGINNIWGQFAKLHERKAVVADMQRQLTEAKRVNETLNKEITQLNNDEYVSQIIRRDFHYSKKGETPLSASKSQ